MSWTADMVQNISTKFKEVVDGFFGLTSREKYNLRDQIEMAKKDWVYAHNYFQNVTDPDLIDHAIFMLEAAEAKYTYLLKQARDPGRVKLQI